MVFRSLERFSPSSAAFLRHGVGRRILLHEPGQCFDVIDRGFRQNAVTKVKDVARASGGATQNVMSTRFHFFPPGKQEYRIEIPLHSVPCANRLPPKVERNPPIQTDDVGPGVAHRGQQSRAVVSEIDDPNTGFLQVPYQFRGAGQDVTTIVFDAEASYPTVK